MSEPTTIFSITQDRDTEIRQTLTEVYDALNKKGYNPVNQLVGYILSEDPTYITTYDGARNKIRKIDRDDLLQAMLKNFLDV
ncbi:MAG: IreB family regulatory phosphoprotein [Pygmaiobacter sp.]